MAAVLLRLCDEDRKKWGGPEWVRFDEDALNDVDSADLSDYEEGMQATFAELYAVDVPRRTVRWRTIEVWLARKMAGVEGTPLRLADFTIKTLKVERREEPAAAASGGGDVVPPDSSGPSTADVPSKKRSR